MTNLQEPNKKDVLDNNDATFHDCIHLQHRNKQIQKGSSQEEQNKFSLYRNTQILISLGIFVLVLISLGLTLGLTIGSRTTVVQSSPITIAQIDNQNSLVFLEIQLNKQRFFREQEILPDILKETPYNIFISKNKKLNKNKNISRLLQQEQETHEQSESYNTYVNLVNLGMSIAISSQKDVKIRVEAELFHNYIQSQLPEHDTRMLMFTPDSFEWAKVREIQNQFGTIIGEQFQTDEKVEIKEEKLTEWVLDDKTGTFILKQGNQTHQRLLEVAEIPSSTPLKSQQLIEPSPKSNIQQAIKPVIEKVVKPIIQLIKDNQKEISVLAESIDQLDLDKENESLGSISGALKRSSLGSIIGDAAQAALKACIPKDSFTIKCTQQSAKNAVVDILKEKVITFIIKDQKFK